MTSHGKLLNIASSLAIGATMALSSWHVLAQQARTPASVNESAPARAGAATVPTGSGDHPVGNAASQPVMPGGAQSPSSVNESAPARAGAASTPTGGQGRSAQPVGATDSMGTLPRTPSSVSESAPARTGPGSVPTARYTRHWDIADTNNDGVIDRFEFDRWMTSERR